jgi:hypothetical protein
MVHALLVVVRRQDESSNALMDTSKLLKLNFVALVRMSTTEGETHFRSASRRKRAQIVQLLSERNMRFTAVGLNRQYINA